MEALTDISSGAAHNLTATDIQLSISGLLIPDMKNNGELRQRDRIASIRTSRSARGSGKVRFILGRLAIRFALPR